MIMNMMIQYTNSITALTFLWQNNSKDMPIWHAN